MYVPLLDLAEGLELRHRYKDNDGLLSTLDIDLTCCGDLKRTQLGLELGNVVLEVDESLRNVDLNLIGRSDGCIRRADDFVLGGGHGLFWRREGLCATKTVSTEPRKVLQIPPCFRARVVPTRASTADESTEVWQQAYRL